MKPHKVVRTHSGSFWCWDSHGWIRTHFDTPHPGLGSKPPPYSLEYTMWLVAGWHPNGLFVRATLDSCDFGADLWLSCCLKQSCRSRRDLSNGMLHVFYTQVFRVESRLLVVGSQNWQTPGSSTPGPSFGHNLCFRCPNEQCEPILDI
jgi:hypothetical protein